MTACRYPRFPDWPGLSELFFNPPNSLFRKTPNLKPGGFFRRMGNYLSFSGWTLTTCSTLLKETSRELYLQFVRISFLLCPWKYACYNPSLFYLVWCQTSRIINCCFSIPKFRLVFRWNKFITKYVNTLLLLYVIRFCFVVKTNEVNFIYFIFVFLRNKRTFILWRQHMYIYAN